MRERIPDFDNNQQHSAFNDPEEKNRHPTELPTAPPLYPVLGAKSGGFGCGEHSSFQCYDNKTAKALDVVVDFSPEHNYKINQIILKHKFLTDETLKRNSLKKKYSKIRKTLTLGEVLLIGGEISITIASVALPALVPLLPVFAGLTASGVGCRFISSYFSKKEKKHETLAVLANSKTRSIEEKFAKALKDGVVSDEEYSTIEREVKLYVEYQEAGERYSRGAGVEITDKMKNEFIEKGRNEMAALLPAELRSVLDSLKTLKTNTFQPHQ